MPRKGHGIHPMNRTFHIKRFCVLCGLEFTPDHPRRTTCIFCRFPKCAICSEPLTIQVKRLAENPVRYCEACYNIVACDINTKRVPNHAPLPIGTRRLDFGGYIRIKVAESGDWKLEHRHIMEGIIGRTLSPIEIVHHKDGNPQNNDPANLELCSDVRDHLDRFHSQRKLRDDEVITMWIMRAAGIRPRALVMVFGMSDGQVSRISRGLKCKTVRTDNYRNDGFEIPFEMCP